MCGLSPKARQIRETDDCDRPVYAAIARVDQCESCPRPFSASVRATSTSICSLRRASQVAWWYRLTVARLYRKS